MILKLLLVLVISWLFHYLPVISAKKDRIKLNEIQTLTLYSDRWTESRRTSPIQQLTCIGGYCNQVQIRSAQCYNRGSDGRSIQWECKADISSEYQFGHLDMSCEGYDSSDDDYILAGSCGLRYTIIKRADNDLKQQQKHSKNMYGNSNNYNNYGSNYKNLKSQTNKNESFSFIPIIVVALIIFFIYYKCIRKKSKPTDDQQQQQPGMNPMTGPGTGGGNQFPFFATPSAPPPPGFRPDLFQQQQQPSPQPFQPPPSYTKYPPGGSNIAGGGGGGGGRSALPGMLGGAAAGGLMGYLLGSMTNRTRPMQQESSYFGSNDYGTGDHHSITDTFMNSSSFGNDDFGGFSGSDDMAEAVGFASTSER